MAEAEPPAPDAGEPSAAEAAEAPIEGPPADAAAEPGAAETALPADAVEAPGEAETEGGRPEPLGRGRPGDESPSDKALGSLDGSGFGGMLVVKGGGKADVHPLHETGTTLQEAQQV